MKKTKFRLALLLFIFSIFIFTSYSIADTLKLHFLDVGQGDSIVIESDNETMIIDGGIPKKSDFIYSYLKKTLKKKTVDYMIATHPHDDHIGGLSGALNACKVGKIYSPTKEHDSRAFASLLKYADKQGLEINIPNESESFWLGDAYVEFLHHRYDYENINNNSLVVRIKHGLNIFLFTGDIEAEAEDELLSHKENIQCTLLKVAHHGSNTSTNNLFLAYSNPKYAVISSGKNNKHGHPNEEVLNRLSQHNITVYRTDLNGTIDCISDGQTLEFKTKKTQKNTKTTLSNTIPSNNYSNYSYIGNRNTKKFHYEDCRSVNKMKDKNKVYLDSREEAIKRGFVPCKICEP